MNTYPVYSARDMVFAEKESSLLEQASVISSSLAAMDSLSGDGAAQVVELLALSGLERILITDASGEVLYDSSSGSAEGKSALLSEIAMALGGNQAFWSRFSDGAFLSRAAMPVTRSARCSGRSISASSTRSNRRYSSPSATGSPPSPRSRSRSRSASPSYSRAG